MLFIYIYISSTFAFSQHFLAFRVDILETPITGWQFHDQRTAAATFYGGNHLLCHRCGPAW